MSDPAEIPTATYQVQFSDYLAICDAHHAHKPKWRRSPWIHWVLTGMIGLYGLFMVSIRQPLVGWFMVGGAGIILLLEFALIPWARRRAYRQQKIDGETMLVQLNDEGLQLVHSKLNSQVRWAAIERIDRFRDGLLLWLSPRQSIFVPDRGFASAEDAAQFHRIAKEKIAGTPPSI